MQRFEPVRVRDAQLEHTAIGDGEPILFIHGAHVADAFVPLAEQPALAEHRRILFRRRGYAGSSPSESPPDAFIADAAADAVELARGVEREPVHVVGHSSGALIALQTALDHPEHVRSVALLEPTLLATPSGPELMEGIKPTVGSYMAGNHADAVDGFMTMVAGPGWQEHVEEFAPGSVEQSIRDAPTFFERELHAVGAWSLDEEKARNVSMPVLYAFGSESHSSASEGLDLVRSWFPHAEHQEIEGTGHFMLTQDPRTVADGIASFIQRHRA